MLRKLIKHEFKATARLIPLLFLIVLTMSVAVHFALKLYDINDLPVVLELLLALFMLLFGAALGAVFIVCIVVMVIRFKRNLLGDEGYLTMTLPVSLSSLIWAKIIVSVIWLILAAIVDFIAVFIAYLTNSSIVDAFRDIWDILMRLSGGNAAVFIEGAVELIIVGLFSVVASCLNFYAALSIGHGFARGKMGFSVLFYFVLSTAASITRIVILAALGQSVFSVTASMFLFGAGAGVADAMSEWRIQMATLGGLSLVQAAVFYFLTWINLKKRLNLE